MEPKTFGWALEQLKASQDVTRVGWNGKGMWLRLHRLEGKMTLPFIAICTVNGRLVPWVASQTDMLAGDWEVAP